MPFDSHTDIPVSSDGKRVVSGGIEKFCYDLSDNFSEIVPVQITKEQKQKRLTKKIITDFVNKENPDIILYHNPWWSRMLMKFDIPLICVMHEPLVRDIRMVDLGNILKELNDSGGHLYFVSEVQLEYHRNMAKRISGVDFGKVQGFIRPSFLQENHPFSEELVFDISTVGRNDRDKDPFVLHKKMKKSGMHSLVMSNLVTYKSDSANEYVEKNKNEWFLPQETIFNLSHDKVLENISKSFSFCSTWPKESFGITALEALGCGVPTILLTNDDDRHASEIIAASSDHIFKIRKKCLPQDFQELVKHVSSLPNTFRNEIREKTLKKHSFEEFSKIINDIFYKREKDKLQKNSLESFFS